jgi:hypothetical protein
LVQSAQKHEPLQFDAQIMTVADTFYVEREADRLLWDAFKTWRGSHQEVSWFSLTSAPGRGNTRLLDHFCEAFERDPYLPSIARIIRVDPADETLANSHSTDLGPIAHTILELHRKASRARYMRLKTWLRHDLLGLVAKFLQTFLLLFVMLLVHEMQRPLHLLSYSWWSTLFAHSVDHPEILVTESIVALIAAVVIEVWKKKKEEAKRTSDEELRQRELESYRSCGSGFFNGLMEMCRGFGTLLLVVDNAHALPAGEKQLLLDLMDFSGRSDPIRKLVTSKRVLVITLDFESTVWDLPEGAGPWFRRIVVRRFSRVELEDILRRASGATQGTDEQLLLELAEQNIKALFFSRDDELRERVKKEFTDKRDAGISHLFDYCELITFWAVRPERSIQKVRLLDWLEGLDNEWLRIFDLRPPRPERIKALVDEFAKSSLVRVDKQTLHLDATACKVLQKWMRRDSQERQLLGQAHYYWLSTITKPLELTHTAVYRHLMANERSAVEQAVFHALKLDDLRDEGMDLFAGAQLSPGQRSQRESDVASVLLWAAQGMRIAGELEEAGIMIDRASNWFSASTPERKSWVTFAAKQAWANYWLSAHHGARERLDRIANDDVAISTEPWWAIQQKLEELVKGRTAVGTRIEPSFAEHDLVNIHRLTDALQEIRQSHGFMSEGLRDASIPISEPVASEEYHWAEFALWELRASAFNRRGDLENLTDTLSKWRQRLLDKRNNADGAPLGIQAYQEYHQARYRHVLLECWKLQTNQTSFLSEEEASTVNRAIDMWITAQYPLQLASVRPIRDLLFEEAHSGYRRALHMAALLGFGALQLEGSFHFGDLLLRFTPEATRKVDQFWWKEWDGLFEACLMSEQTSSWNMHLPDIHRLRWEYFAKVDRPTSLSDAYNTLQWAKKCGYPTAVIVPWHERVSRYFTNFSDTTEDRKRSVELHETWARNLANLPEASKFRHFRHSLPLEQASSLQFAAQDERMVRDFGRASQLLDEADSLFQASATSEHEEEVSDVRDLGVGLRMQRAWLLEAKGDDVSRYRRLVRELWCDLEPDCQHNANVLGSLLGIEDDEKLLDDGWPPPGVVINVDPDNQALSLPGEWFQGLGPIKVHNRYEYRFRQLLYMGSKRSNPTRPELIQRARDGWMGQEHFGETTLKFAELDLDKGYSTNCRDMLITLLEAVARGFHEEHNGQQEMASYRCLMKYEPRHDSYRSSYIDVLIQLKELLERELRVLGLEQMDWLRVAERLHHYFSVLVDEDLFRTKVAEEIHESGRTASEFEARQRQLTDVLAKARDHWSRGARKECLDALEPILNFSRVSWVSLAHLEAIDLWLNCARSVHEPPIAKLNDRAALLRSLTLRYIGQFGRTIEDPRAQQLANQLLEMLQGEQVKHAA